MADIYNNPDVSYDSYLEPPVPQLEQQVLSQSAVTNINSLTGPNITFAGGTSGFAYTPAGTTITLASPLTAKGDLYTHDATNGTKLVAAADDARLTTASAEVTGLKWIAASTGWADATGTAARTALASYAGQVVSNPPTQAEVQALDDAVKALYQWAVALTNDLFTQKVIKP